MNLNMFNYLNVNHMIPNLFKGSIVYLVSFLFLLVACGQEEKEANDIE